MQRTDSFVKTLMLGKIESRRKGLQRMGWLDSITDSMDMSLRKLREIGKDREAWQFSGVTKSRHDLDVRTIPTRIISNLIYKTTNL